MIKDSDKKMTASEIGKARARNNFSKKKSNKPDNYLKAVIKGCSEHLEFKKKHSFSDDVKWCMRAFSMDKEQATKFKKKSNSSDIAENKEMIKLCTKELERRKISLSKPKK